MPNLCGVNQKLLAEALSSVKRGAYINNRLFPEYIVFADGCMSWMYVRPVTHSMCVCVSVSNGESTSDKDKQFLIERTSAIIGHHPSVSLFSLFVQIPRALFSLCRYSSRRDGEPRKCDSKSRQSNAMSLHTQSCYWMPLVWVWDVLHRWQFAIRVSNLNCTLVKIPVDQRHRSRISRNIWRCRRVSPSYGNWWWRKCL